MSQFIFTKSTSQNDIAVLPSSITTVDPSLSTWQRLSERYRPCFCFLRGIGFDLMMQPAGLGQRSELDQRKALGKGRR